MMGEPSQPHKIRNMNQATNSQETEVPTINEPLLLEIPRGFRSRGTSVSSFFSTTSTDSQTGMETTPQEQDDKIVVTRMHGEIEKMVNATARQKNISIVVKSGFQKLKAILDELAKTTQSEPPRSSKRVRSPADSPEQIAQAQKKKKDPTSEHPPATGTTIVTPGTGTAEQHGNWERVENKKKKKRGKKKSGGGQKTLTDSTNGTIETGTRSCRVHKAPKQRGGVVLIRPTEGKTFTDIVRTLRTVDNTGDSLTVKSVSKTKDGDALVRTHGDRRPEKELSGLIRNALGDQGVIKNMTPRVTVDILDMDCLTETQEVQDALNRDLEQDADRKVSVLGPNSRGLKIAICELDGQDATRLLKTGRIRVGLVNCRVRARRMVPRCYKCLGYGHYKQNCTGPDRQDCCWKCGEPGHVAKACRGAPSCFHCTSRGDGSAAHAAHVAGTAACHAFRTALTEAKTRQQTSRTK